MRVLITGAGGFIGSHVTEYLANKKFKIDVLIKYNSNSDIGWLKNLNNKIRSKINFHFGDIRDSNYILEITKNIDVIVNLAALISIPYSYKSQNSYFQTNLDGTLNILNAAKKNKIKHIILTSTSEVYGSALYVPMDEKHPLQPQSPYSASKISADAAGISYYNSFDLPVTILRPFNCFGPRQSNRAIIPRIINQLKKNPNNIKLGNLYPRRDFTYVEDTAEGFFKVIKAGKKTFGKTINIGSSHDISMRDVLKKISEIMDVKYKLKSSKKHKRPTKSEVDRLLADSTIAKKLLNWKPKYSGKYGFSKGLKKTIEWNLKNNSELNDFVF